MQLQYSSLESNRFNMNIYRDGVLDSIDASAISAALEETKADVYMFRLPCERISELNELSQVKYPYIVADTLVYYTCPLIDFVPKQIRNKDLVFRIASEDDYDLLGLMTEKIFEDYTNHYSSNIHLDLGDINEGYKEWVRSYVKPAGAEKNCILVERDGLAIAYATVSFDYEGLISEGILYGVMPDFSGGGVYGDIVRHTQLQSINNGMLKMRVSTQVQNYAVQKVWAREGFSITDSYLTVHINSLISKNSVT